MTWYLIKETETSDRYFRIDTQSFSRGWRFWVYHMEYDGVPHTALHLGPIVVSWSLQ